MPVHPIIFVAFVSAFALSAAFADVLRPLLPRCEAMVIKFGACAATKAAAQ